MYWGYHSGHHASVVDTFRTLGATDICVADLDLDGAQDVVYANGGFTAGESYIYFGDGSGGFAEQPLGLPTVAASSCLVYDLNSDSLPDVVFGSYYAAEESSEVSQIYWGSADGFSAGDLLELPTTSASGVAVAGPTQ